MAAVLITPDQTAIRQLMQDLTRFGAKRAPKLIAQSLKATTSQMVKIAKTFTPKGSRKRRAQKKKNAKSAGKSPAKALQQSVKYRVWQRDGKFKSVVTWGGQAGLAGYANVLNFGQKKRTNKTGINVFSSRRGSRIGWGKKSAKLNASRVDAIMLGELRKRYGQEASK